MADDDHHESASDARIRASVLPLSAAAARCPQDEAIRINLASMKKLARQRGIDVHDHALAAELRRASVID